MRVSLHQHVNESSESIAQFVDGIAGGTIIIRRADGSVKLAGTIAKLTGVPVKHDDGGKLWRFDLEIE